MNELNRYVTSEHNTPFFEPKRKAGSLRPSFSDSESELIEHFSKALKSTFINTDASATWLATKRKGIEAQEPNSHPSKKVKNVIEDSEKEIPFKANPRQKSDEGENRKKRLKLPAASVPEGCGVIEFGTDAPSWTDIDDLGLRMKGLSMVRALDDEPVESIVSCLSMRDSKQEPVIASQSVVDSLIQQLGAFAEIDREKVVSLYSIRNEDGNCCLFDRQLFDRSIPYLASLIERDPDLLFDLLTIMDQWREYAFMWMGMSSAAQELFSSLALNYPKRVLGLAGLPLKEGLTALHHYQTLCLFLSAAEALADTTPAFALELFSTIIGKGKYFLSKQVYAVRIAACLKAMAPVSPAMVEEILTAKAGGKSLLSYPEFTQQAKSLIMEYPRLLKEFGEARKKASVISRVHKPLDSKTAVINLQPQADSGFNPPPRQAPSDQSNLEN